jgi:hypothetical protein
MAQSPLGFGVQGGTSKAQMPFVGDAPTSLASGAGLAVAGISGTSSRYNITGPTVIKTNPGRAVRYSVIVAGTGVGSINDCVTTGAAGVANQITVTPTTVGTYPLEWPAVTGIVVVPGAGQTLAIAYS